MIRNYILSFAFLIMLQTSHSQESIDLKEMSARLDQNIGMVLEENHVPGIAIAILKDGDVVYQKQFGFADKANEIPITGQTGFNIGSISKVFTAWGIMKLVQKGEIDLDLPANKYLTKWQLPPSEFDHDKVTVRRMLSHSAGLSVHGYPGWNDPDKLPTLEESLSGIPKNGTAVKVIFEPGTRFKYSGGGYSIMQLMIEEVTGDSFEHYMDTAVIKPLEMNRSSFTIDKEILSNSSLEHNKKGKVIPFEYFTAQGAAGFHTTLDDMIKFVREHQKLLGDTEEYSVISPSILREMLSVIPATEELNTYGLGYNKYEHDGGGSWGHGGANSGWMAHIRMRNTPKTGLIVLTNSYGGLEVIRQVVKDWNNWYGD